MNKSLFILFLIINGLINPNQQLIQMDNNIIKSNSIVINHEYYDLTIRVEKTNNKNNLIVDLVPKKNSYFVSPNEKQNFTGKYNMSLGSYNNLSFDEHIIESPIAKLKNEFGPQVSAQFCQATKWISEKTTYIQALKIKTKEDFEVFGRIQFTIEPSCTFEQIPFAIRYKNGVMSLFSPKC